MASAYREQAQHILASPDRFRKARATRIGLESEIAIHSPQTPLVRIEELRNAIIAEIPDIGDVELGAAQIEFRTPPIDLSASDGVRALALAYRGAFESLSRAANRRGCSIIRCGTNPFLPVKNAPRTSTLKYRMVPDFYNLHRPKGVDTLIGPDGRRVEIGDAAIISLLQSFQVNLEAHSFEDACDKANRSLMISPYLLAIAGNSRYLACTDTEMNDLRMVTWEKSHDTGTKPLRVGLPELYFPNITDYLDRVGRFPFILHNPDAALAIAIGMTWLDARIKFIGDSLVVELRSLPTQPTQEEELFLTLLYVGRLADSQARRESLLPILYVAENRRLAMRYGTRRDMWFVSDNGAPERLPCKIGIGREVARAHSGLQRLGLAEWIAVYREFLDNESPSERLARALGYADIVDPATMEAALRITGMLG